MAYVCVRTEKIGGYRKLQTIEAHGRREDEESRTRADPARFDDNIAESSVDDPLAVVEAFKQRKAETGAREYKGAPVGVHVLCTVSPEWIKEAGGLHDPQNPRNLAFYDASKKWAEDRFGKGSVIASRMDMDERGGGAVDLVVVPVHEVKQRGKVKSQISVNKSYEKAFGGGRVYSKMQDDFAEHCQNTLDKDLQRGKPKSETQREHVHAAIIGPALEAKANAEKARDEALEREKTAKKQAAEAEARLKEREEQMQTISERWNASIKKLREKHAELTDKIRNKNALIQKKNALIQKLRTSPLKIFATARTRDVNERVSAAVEQQTDGLVKKLEKAQGELSRSESREAGLRAENRTLSGRLYSADRKYSLITEHVAKNVPGASAAIKEGESAYEELLRREEEQKSPENSQSRSQQSQQSQQKQQARQMTRAPRGPGGM